MMRGLHLRTLCKRDWPVFGITHDLSEFSIHRDVFVALNVGFESGDSIVCASAAANAVMKKLCLHMASSDAEQKSPISLPIVPHGIDVESFKKQDKTSSRERLMLPEKAFIFLYFGRLSVVSKADLEGLIRVFGVTFPNPGSMLVLGGDLSDKRDQENLGKLRRLIYESNLHKRVQIFVDPDEQQKELLFSSADVFVSPANSCQESFGISVAEAMAFSLPTIVSDWNGYRDIVVHDQTGFLVPTKFVNLSEVAKSLPFESEFERRLSLTESAVVDRNSLGHYMQVLLENPGLAERLGAAGYERARSV